MAFRPDLKFGLLAAALALGASAVAVPADDPLGEAAAALTRGDGIAAEVAARRALEAGAARSEVAAFAGEAELLQGDLGDAREWLGAGDFALGSRERGFHALGRLEMAEGDLAAASAAFDRALALGGTAKLWVDIGRLRYRGGQHHLALDAAAKAVALDPAEPRALEFRAQLTRDAVGLNAALPLFESALDKAPDDIELLGEYAATLGEAGRNRDMLRVARRMVELDPRHPRAYYLQAVLAARAGLDDLARRLLARTNGAYDDTPSSLLLDGLLELRSGDAALAVDRFDELARRQPDNAEVAMLLGRALLADGEANEVIARFETTARRADASPYLLTLVGRAYEQAGRRQQAARYLDRASAAPPTGLGVLAPGGGSQVQDVRRLLADGRHDEAAVVVAGLRTEFPDSMDVEVLAGDVALLSGDPVAALANYRRAAQVRRDFALVERMARAQRLLGNEGQARRLLGDYLAQHPRSLQAAALLGRLRAQHGDWTGARALLAYADALAGGDARLRADLAEAERHGGAASLASR